mmetsp:Transcript_1281/g.2526  ORF Transcript_1281/g.2526 Transcript_1281/m.2526 type:complete len:106 (-) Transcript_1281:267-584(-)
MLQSYEPETWNLRAGKFFEPSLRDVYTSLALYVHVQGKNVAPSRSSPQPRPLETQVKAAITHFQDKYPTVHILNTKGLLKLCLYSYILTIDMTSQAWRQPCFRRC